MTLKVHINPERISGRHSPMLYGHFIEHFHRQIYGGIYQPGHPLSESMFCALIWKYFQNQLVHT